MNVCCECLLADRRTHMAVAWRRWCLSGVVARTRAKSATCSTAMMSSCMLASYLNKLHIVALQNTRLPEEAPCTTCALRMQHAK